MISGEILWQKCIPKEKASLLPPGPTEPNRLSGARLAQKKSLQLPSTSGNRVSPHAEIGMILRDRYGVPDAKLITGKKVTTILKENNVASNVPEDLTNLIVKALKLRKHLSVNKKDVHNKRSLNLTESKIQKTC